jgi:hypothetical protein
VYARVEHRCECCNIDTRDSANGTRIEAHERWLYELNGTQKLMRLVALCHECHEVTHIGLAEVNGRLEPAMAHYCRVANISQTEAADRRAMAYDLWHARNAQHWTPDISILQDAGVETVPPPDCGGSRSAYRGVHAGGADDDHPVDDYH